MKLESIELNNLGSKSTTLSHPAITRLHDGRYLATMQDIKDGDYYGDPFYSISSDQGKSWSEPAVIEAFKSFPIPGSPLVEAVADVRVFTLQDGTVAAMGCSIFYSSRGNVSWDKESKVEIPQEFAYVSIYDPATDQWGARQVLELPLMGSKSYRTACTQAVLLGEDKIIVPIYFDTQCQIEYYGYTSSRYASLTAIYRKVNGRLEFEAASNVLEIPVLRGCIEPSVIDLPQGGYALTLRAEDGRMYVSLSADALNWGKIRPWTWDDDSEIETESTQQHWIKCGDRRFLAYTRNDGTNGKIMRFRAPLYIAEADAEKAQLIRSSEKVAFPRQNIKGVEVLYGNFHCTQLDDNTGLITDAAIYTVVRDEKMHETSSTVMGCKVTVEK